MKKLSLFAFLLLSVAAFAQSKFIEVEVTDTISLRPVSFQCNIYVDSSDSLAVALDEDYDPMANAENEKNKLQEIKTKLEAKKYKVSKLDQSKGNILTRRFYGANGWSVVVNGETEMQKLKNFLGDDANMEVAVLQYADMIKAEEQLIKKIMDKAKARAAVIGVNSGLKPGRIIEVSEGKKGESFDMDNYMTQIMKMSGMGEDNGNYTGSLSKTFVVKFAAE